MTPERIPSVPFPPPAFYSAIEERESGPWKANYPQRSISVPTRQGGRAQKVVHLREARFVRVATRWRPGVETTRPPCGGLT